MLCIAVPFAWLLHLRFMPSRYLMVLVMSLRKGHQKNVTCCSSSSISSRCSSSTRAGGSGWVLAVLVMVWVVVAVSIIMSVFSEYPL